MLHDNIISKNKRFVNWIVSLILMPHCIRSRRPRLRRPARPRIERASPRNRGRARRCGPRRGLRISFSPVSRGLRSDRCGFATSREKAVSFVSCNPRRSAMPHQIGAHFQLSRRQGWVDVTRNSGSVLGINLTVFTKGVRNIALIFRVASPAILDSSSSVAMCPFGCLLLKT